MYKFPSLDILEKQRLYLNAKIQSKYNKRAKLFLIIFPLILCLVPNKTYTISHRKLFITLLIYLFLIFGLFLTIHSGNCCIFCYVLFSNVIPSLLLTLYFAFHQGFLHFHHLTS